MNKTIWKFIIAISDNVKIEMPIGAEVLTVQNQEEHCCIWALVNPEAETEERYFDVFGTGHEVYCDMGIERKYINTFQMHAGQLVFHVFERID